MKKKYLVVGIWEDGGGRWADSYEAESPEEAEEMAKAEYETDESGELIIAGVIDAETCVVVA